MSISFNKIVVNDFISIGTAELEFNNGVYLVRGINKDKQEFEDTSNGAGKTTVFSAIYQGLFNKNSKDSKATIEAVNNIYTGRAYNIDITFQKDSDTYKVINDRNKNKIVIFKNDIDVTPKSVNAQLKYIKEVIGFDFGTFSSLTFLNSASLDSIMDLTNKNNIVYQFFDIEALTQLTKNIKRRKKELDEQRIAISSKLSVLDKQVSLLKKNTEESVDGLLEEEKNLFEDIAKLESALNSEEFVELEKKIKTLENVLNEYSIELVSLKKDGEQKSKLLEKLKIGVCPTCGADYTTDITPLEGEINELRRKYSSVSEDKDKVTGELAELRDSIRRKNSVINKELTEKKQRLKGIQVSIAVIQDRNTQREDLIKDLSKLEEEREALIKELPFVELELKAIDGLLAVFKSGAVVNEYLRKYRILLTKNFKSLTKHTSFDLDIKIKVNKGKMTYVFFDDGVEKPFGMLSAGERTRVSLILLLATLKTIEQLTNITINYLVLDELLGVLDAEGINFLKNVLSEMRKEKSIYIITHHDEIDESFADGIITVVKENNISRVE